MARIRREMARTGLPINFMSDEEIESASAAVGAACAKTAISMEQIGAAFRDLHEALHSANLGNRWER